ncbi:MAG: DUF4134 domain-containing protein [Puia sp.]|nr:DUF4134 domain-containing protein [Puia sp.]
MQKKFHLSALKIRALRLHTLLATAAMFTVFRALAQTADGNAGINQANTTIRGYFDAATNLMYAIGAIMGIIGALKVFDRVLHGHSESTKYAAAWLGGCLFLVIVSSVLRSFFGL